jgi:hypothetical protein
VLKELDGLVFQQGVAAYHLMLYVSQHNKMLLKEIARKVMKEEEQLDDDDWYSGQKLICIMMMMMIECLSKKGRVRSIYGNMLNRPQQVKAAILALGTTGILCLTQYSSFSFILILQWQPLHFMSLTMASSRLNAHSYTRG